MRHPLGEYEPEDPQFHVLLCIAGFLALTLALTYLGA